MTIEIYNTLTRQKEAFVPLEPGRVRMYVCGPTVYAEAHVGHAMSSIVFDVVRRYLEYRGFEIHHVMNFTDVDDKIIARAAASGEDPFRLSSRFAEKYQKQLSALNVLPPHEFPRVSGTIPEIIAMIQGLVMHRHAYVTPGGDVYFRVRSFSQYGKLSHRRIEEAVSGTRVASSEEKNNDGDFALWKSAKPGEPSWNSPWGHGRPGWHIECSAMNLRYLGEQIDIHGGGNDLIFPHHENEIAQSESFTGKPFARYWMHNGMLQLKGEKMSKSIGNLITIDQFLAEHPAEVLRLVIIGSGYRKPLVFNDEVIADAEHALDRLRGGLRPATGTAESGAAVDTLRSDVWSAVQAFENAMDDDFNTASALAAVYDLLRCINTARQEGAGPLALSQAQERFEQLAGVLGLRLTLPTAEGTAAAPFIDLLLEVRRDLRQAKQFALSDKIRVRLNDLGVTVEDTAQGSSWRIS
jgi:cysteinyl-tRNA synthetase